MDKPLAGFFAIWPCHMANHYLYPEASLFAILVQLDFHFLMEANSIGKKWLFKAPRGVFTFVHFTFYQSLKNIFLAGHFRLSFKFIFNNILPFLFLFILQKRLQKELMSLIKDPPPGVVIDEESAGQSLDL